MSDYRWVGKAVRRIDGEAKVRGSLAFPSDVSVPEMLHCRPVLAPYPSARLLGVETAAALRVPGVVRVLTARDVPALNCYGDRGDHPVLCDERVRYTGDMVAVVVAETEEAAERGASLVEVPFEKLPLVTDPEQALSDPSVLVHERGNILHQVHYAVGDVDAVFARTDVVIVERVYRPHIMDHAFIETESGVAYPDGPGVCVISGGQNAYYDQRHVARALGLPLEHVRMIESYTGGAFGGKGDITVQIVVALAALLTQRPCRMAWTRSEHFRAGVKRHPATIRIRTAASASGDLLALEARELADTGAYAVFGEGVLELMAESVAGAYRIPNTRVDAWSVYTNNMVAGAFRGFGATQGCLAVEGQMSEMAQRLGMDEIEFRLRNALCQGDHAGPGHLMELPMAIKQALELARQHPLWQQRSRLKASARTGPIRRGVGMAIAMKGFGLGCNDAGDYSAADISLQDDGRYLVKTGILELGQGSFTVLSTLAAETLHCSPAIIDVRAGDTSDCPEAGTTASSRVTYAVGRAVVAAAGEIVTLIRGAAAEVWQVPVEQVELGDGVVWDRQTENQLSLRELATLAPDRLRVSHRQRIPYSERKIGTGLGHPHLFYSSNTQIVQVAVDVETGEVTVERVVIFPEVGQVVSRLGLEGQCEGGVAMGIGYALMEQVLVDRGVVLNGDLTRYPVPTAADVCTMETIPVEVPEPTGPFGAKGAAENATLPTAPAILDAIADAIGIRFTSMPVTPERILEALAGEARC